MVVRHVDFVLRVRERGCFYQQFLFNWVWKNFDRKAVNAKYSVCLLEDTRWRTTQLYDTVNGEKRDGTMKRLEYIVRYCRPFERSTCTDGTQTRAHAIETCATATLYIIIYAPEWDSTPASTYYSNQKATKIIFRACVCFAWHDDQIDSSIYRRLWKTKWMESDQNTNVLKNMVAHWAWLRGARSTWIVIWELILNEKQQ